MLRIAINRRDTAKSDDPAAGRPIERPVPGALIPAGTPCPGGPARRRAAGHEEPAGPVSGS